MTLIDIPPKTHRPIPLRPATSVHSKWCESPPNIDGRLATGEWSKAGVLSIPKGHLLVANDARALYVALDLTSDFTEDVVDDFFWLYIDVDRNGKPTPYHDLQYAPTSLDRTVIGCWRVKGPQEVDLDVPVPTRGRLGRGFGPSTYSQFPHRIWELAIELEELGVKLEPFGTPPEIRFGLHLESRNPAFYVDVPPNAPSDFKEFLTIVLANDPIAYQAGTEGPVIGGVGHIPATKIDANGLATFGDLGLLNCAFGGTLCFMQNVTNVHSLIRQGAKTFAVLHRWGADASAIAACPWTPLMTSWKNWRWTGKDYVAEFFGPDTNGCYALIDPTVEYSLKSLLFAWDTANAPDMLYELEVVFYDANAKVIATPSQIVALRIDNRPPAVAILDIKHGEQSVQPCQIVDLSGADDPVTVDFRACDGEGLLSTYALFVRYGDNQTKSIARDDYSTHQASPFWFGETSKSAKFTTETTCAYDFVIRAWGRVTNGYDATQCVESHRSVTLKLSNPSPILKPHKFDFSLHLPPGFSKEGLRLKE